MRIATTMHDSIVDGPGLRFTVFTQGCPHHCPGCHNPETHDPEGGQVVSIEELAIEMKKNPLTSGLTLSGGEPFLQAVDCARLATTAHTLGYNVWTYTGYLYEFLCSAGNPNWEALLAQSDVLVDGPFQMEEKSYGAQFRGSRNQRLIDLKESRRTGTVVLWKPKDLLAHFKVPES